MIIKLSIKSFFIILILAILEFRNVSRSALRRSKFWPPPVSGLNTVSSLFILQNRVLSLKIMHSFTDNASYIYII